MCRLTSLLLCLLASILAIATTGCGALICLGSGGEWKPYADLWTTSQKEGCTFTKAAGTSASAGEVLFLSTSAHLVGALGTNWRSDVELHSVGEQTAVVRVVLLEHAADHSSPRWQDFVLEPGRSLRLDDVLDRQFDLDGKAALVLAVSAGRMIATSRTYNLLAAGNPFGLPGGSTFGQHVPALARGEAIRTGEQGRVIQLSNRNSATGGFRTNLGLVNATSEPTRVEIDLHAADGTQLGGIPVDLPAYGYRQLDRVFNSVTANEVADGYAIVRTPTASGSFFAYASVIDNLTGDPITVSATRLPEVEPAGNGGAVWVIGAAHLAGVGGTNWRTDLEVHAWGARNASFAIDMLKHGEDNTTPERKTYTVPAGTSRRFPDVLKSELGFDGKATLRVTPTSGHLVVTSRTYNLLGAGNPLGLPAGATFGQFIPALEAAAAIRSGEEGRLIQLAHDPGSTGGFRTNLALQSASAAAIDVEVDLHRSDGTRLGTLTEKLKPYEYRQLNGVFAGVTAGRVDDGYAVVRPTTSGGQVMALASVVDNLTGDPVGMPAAVVISAPAEGALGEVNGILDVMAGTTIEDSVDFIQGAGKDALIGILVSANPAVTTRTPSGMVIDWGSGYTEPDGTVRSGKVTADFSGLTISSSAIKGTVEIRHDNVLVDGKPPSVGPAKWTVDLVEKSNGTVAGSISAQPLGTGTSPGSISGTIVLDTALCERYPISGSLTIVHDGGTITIAPSPDCERRLDRDVTVAPPGYDFRFAYADPTSPKAAAFIASAPNATVFDEGLVRYWKPGVGGKTFETTTPGVITSHFAFDRPIVGGRLLTTIASFHWSYSKGHTFLYGSTDGSTWQKLSEVPPPGFGTGKAGGWNGPLPELFIGAKHIWLQTRLYSYGPSAPSGGVWTNTAQAWRWDVRSTANSFDLAVDLQD
ncbi:MAG: hypothetical protein AB2L07_19590 [Thermoanaerobaculaceae bacterium]